METVTFDHTPHYKTLCGKQSHFSRISDAIAEFVDNSIQACKDCQSKQIELNLLLSKCATRSYLIISDNGKLLGLITIFTSTFRIFRSRNDRI